MQVFNEARGTAAHLQSLRRRPTRLTRPQFNKVDLDQLAARATVVVSLVSFREVTHEPGAECEVDDDR